MLYVNTNNEENRLYWECLKCGYSKEDTKGGLIMETRVQEFSNEGYKLINEFTADDPTLPHIKTIQCPNETCPSRRGDGNDVLYIKYDPVNLKYLYICAKCKQRWRSR